MATHSDLANLVWQIADLLRGPYRPPQYERVMLPLVVLRRFDCVLADTKPKVLAEYERRKGGRLTDDALDSTLNKAAGHRFHNRSELDFQKLKGDPDNLNKHLVSYIKGFSANVQRIFEYFEFESEIERMHEAGILYLVISGFCDVDLHPRKVKNQEMGLIFENLIRRFNELANETAGDHFTPREVITLMIDLLLYDADELLSKPGIAMRMLDPACGTGGMLAGAQKYMRDHHDGATLYVYGQDYNKRAFATAASDMLMKEVDHNGGGENVQFGDSFLDDKFAGQTFDYFIANPPFGVDWKRQQKEIVRRHEKAPQEDPWSAGLPRVNDGSLLFLQHMISKFEDVDPKKQKYGSRAAIVFSGSPLFTGGAGGGESEIRRWVIERDLLEAIVALPEQMFYNTGIGTYIWIVTNRKAKDRKGQIQLVDARDTSIPMRRSQGDKRRKIGEGPALEDDRADEPDQIADIVRLYGAFEPGEKSNIFDNADFGYTRVTVERPLRLRYQMTVEDKARLLDAAPHLLDDVQAIDKALGREPQLDWNAAWSDIEKLLKKRGSRWKAPEEKLFRSVFTAKDPTGVAVKRGPGLEADSDLRDFENVPLKEDIDAYFKREVLPHVPDAWMDRAKDKVGYEINFNRHFYKFTPPRKLTEIDADLKKAEDEILRLLREVTK
ncbi:type I restriction-modification system subunit M [Caulobacter sp. ErkDOM-E]|uniref:type I restriction-modification system subunit M n=1 Tax=Caulobacter sp. ErkDOM-E TaxID=3402778 RepID=UPI003AF75CC5